MATIADVSQALGDYMLKGWVLTDQSCPTPGCTVPLLRSPRGRTPITTFCVKCSAEPQASQLPNAPAPSSSDVSSYDQDSRPSTPPTEFSDTLSSQLYEPPPESEESRRRREQSDHASSEIGRKLLTGWAMLGDECPNETCYGVPLVRPPKVGGEINPRKECVICGNSYTTEVDWAGREGLRLHQATVDITPPPPRQNTSHQATTSSIQPQSMSSIKVESQRHTFSSPFESQLKNTDLSSQTVSPNIDPSTQLKPSPNSSNIALEKTERALNESLDSLSGRLAMLSCGSHMDAPSIGGTADAIGKVVQALAQLRQLQRSENQASRTS